MPKEGGVTPRTWRRAPTKPSEANKILYHDFLCSLYVFYPTSLRPVQKLKLFFYINQPRPLNLDQMAPIFGFTLDRDCLVNWCYIGFYHNRGQCIGHIGYAATWYITLNRTGLLAALGISGQTGRSDSVLKTILLREYNLFICANIVRVLSLILYCHVWYHFHFHMQFIF